MLIPSLDLMGGKIVQLVQGEKKALEFTNAAEWVERFARYPTVQVDRSRRRHGKRFDGELVSEFCRQLPCQVGGGIRSPEIAAEVIENGAKRVIVGSSLLRDGQIDIEFAKSSLCAGSELNASCGYRRPRWTRRHPWMENDYCITPSEMMHALQPYCSAFLYTHIDTEGLLQGIPLEVVRELRRQTDRQFIAAGGIRSREEVDALHELGIDAVVGMAIYSGLIKV